MRSDPSLVLAAIPHSGFVLGFAAEELRQRKTFVLQAVKLNGYALIGAGAEPGVTGLGNKRGIYVHVPRIEVTVVVINFLVYLVKDG
jgi:hypothetical protein